MQGEEGRAGSGARAGVCGRQRERRKDEGKWESPKRARCSVDTTASTHSGDSSEFRGSDAGEGRSSEGSDAALDMERDGMDDVPPPGGFLAYKARRVIHNVVDQLAPAAVLVQAWTAGPCPFAESSSSSTRGDESSQGEVLRPCGEGWVLGAAWGGLRTGLHSVPVGPGQGAVGRAWVSGGIEVVQDPSSEPLLSGMLQAAYVGSIMAVPVYDERARCSTVCPHGGPPFGAAGCALCARPELVIQVVFTRADSPLLRGTVPGQAAAAATKLAYECNLGRLCGMFEGWLAKERLALTRPESQGLPAGGAQDEPPQTVHPSAALRCQVVLPQVAVAPHGGGGGDSPGMVKSPSQKSLGAHDRYAWEGKGSQPFCSGDTNS